MLHHSLFTEFLRNNGMQTDKNDETTRDVICIDFQFGLRSYEEELDHLAQMRAEAELKENPEEKENALKVVTSLEEKVHERKDLFHKMSKDEIREELYIRGAPITYTWINKKGSGEVRSETINYKMLYRNPSKAKQGSCMFIREELYDKAHEWMTMGLANKLDYDNAKIVEISAYAPLSASAIEGKVYISPDDVLILEDQDSLFRTIADVVKSGDYYVTEKILDEDYLSQTGKRRYNKVQTVKKRCVIERKETMVSNTMWDGMALIDVTTMPQWCNGMALLRSHFFKACAFKTRIQDFIKDYCEERNIDYNTFVIKDMFGVGHLAKNVKLITTDQSIKWKRFSEYMGNTIQEAYEYWLDRIKADGCVWGIVKTDHPSKLGGIQQMSYQMINSLPCSKEDIYKIAQTSVDYVETLKSDDNEFLKFLRHNANEVNHYDMLADLYERNVEFRNTRLWRVDKSSIIATYVNHLRKGKITIAGDNLTVCGNPYALLLYSVEGGTKWQSDPTLNYEEGAVQCYAPMFEDGEYLCGIRNPHNAPNNIAYYHNVKHPLMIKYFDFSDNIIAVNCIRSDIQARCNGMD